MQSINPAEKSMLAMSAPRPFVESDLPDLAVAVQKYIDRLAEQCQQQSQEQLATVWTAAESTLASLPQRVVSDHLSTEDPTGLPYYHPLHWFQSQLEFKLQGILEYNDSELASQGVQAVLQELQPLVADAIAVFQTDIADNFDLHLQSLRQSLALALQPQLADSRVIVAEYINSHVPLAKLQFSEAERFGFFAVGKRFVPGSVVVATSKFVKPWYMFGFQEKQVSCYQIAIEQLQPVLQESLERSFQNIKTKVAGYISQDLQSQIQQLFANI